MRYLQQHRSLTISLSVVVILIAGGTFHHLTKTPPTPDAATVETGTVRSIVAVSGVVEAKQLAELAFPTTGIVTGIFVDDGSPVKAGDVLATLSTSTLLAERTEAENARTAAEAEYSRLFQGPRPEIVGVAEVKVANAEAKLTRVESEEAEKVASARRAVLSNNLVATSDDPTEAAVPPTISGTYRCNDEGTYTLRLYSANSESGYAYKVSGLEQSEYEASTLQPTPLGSCGLFVLITSGSRYSNTTWTITIPNTRAPNYQTLNNTYLLAKTEADNRIREASDDVTLAKRELTLSSANTESTVLQAARAAVLQAQSRVDAIDSRLADRSIVAPFDGIVTESNLTIGESAPTIPVITLLANDTFSLKARVPEIDITKIALEQKVEATFDAKTDTVITGRVRYISPVATIIDGVAYFTVTVDIDIPPTWLRAGLNADIDIITKSTTANRLPTRFISGNTVNGFIVNLPNTGTTTVTIDHFGTDGYAIVPALPVGTVVIAP